MENMGGKIKYIKVYFLALNIQIVKIPKRGNKVKKWERMAKLIK